VAHLGLLGLEEEVRHGLVAVVAEGRRDHEVPPLQEERR